jgi:hypothetical protein
LKDVHFAVANLAAFSQIAGQRPAGLIGANILRRFLVTIDYPKRQVVLSHPDHAINPPDAIVISTKPALGMSGVLVDGELDGHKLSFLIDTGAAFNNISSRLAKPILTVPLLPVGDLEGLDGRKVKTGSVRFKTLRIGAWSVSEPVFSVAPSDSNPAGIISGGSLAILGNPIWRNYRLTIDYKNQRLFLERSETAKATQESLSKLGSIEIRHLDKPLVDVVEDYRQCLQEIRAKHLLGAEAICLADLALTLGDKAEQPNSDATLLKMTNLFKDAQCKAAQSQDNAIEAQVLSKWGTYLILHSRSKDLASPLLAEAIRFCPTESCGYAATALLVLRRGNAQLAEQLVDQALMLDPANWQALWLKYDLACKQRSSQLKMLVIDHLRKYYRDSAKVAALSAPAHSQARSRTAARRS